MRGGVGEASTRIVVAAAAFAVTAFFAFFARRMFLNFSCSFFQRSSDISFFFFLAPGRVP